ncbi:MAG: phosphoglucosamine mutase [Desulfamplus sp.]|nr:phosphoglucosamine mutase [Desulfamplus sp.]
MKRLFGTDGIRGVANRFPMTAKMAMNIGIAVARYVKQLGYGAVIIGKDTRISGDMLESALGSGITSQGVHVLAAGVIPTPGVAFLSSYFGYFDKQPIDLDEKWGMVGAGVMISASHNPWQDNGIKLFKRGGFKLSDDEEADIESMILAALNSNVGDELGSSDIGRIYPIVDAKEIYCNFLKNTFNPKSNLRQLKIVVDCSNGASSSVASHLFCDQTLSCFNPTFIFNEPDGKNINERCGSQHTEKLSQKVVELEADVGLAFDGDADRLIAVDEMGQVITGDRILAICAAYSKSKSELDNNLVVTTVMSNIGLVRALKELGIDHLITGVGDREVLKKMVEYSAVMGGEDSGHMIFLKYHTTGDGLLTALRLLEVMMDTDKSLSELASIMKVYPQVLMNVEVDASRPDFMAIKPIADEIKSVEAELGSDGRVLVRYSGTQPLLRVMVEGPDHDKTKECCKRICDKIRAYKP